LFDHDKSSAIPTTPAGLQASPHRHDCWAGTGIFPKSLKCTEIFHAKFYPAFSLTVPHRRNALPPLSPAAARLLLGQHGRWVHHGGPPALAQRLPGAPSGPQCLPHQLSSRARLPSQRVCLVWEERGSGPLVSHPIDPILPAVQPWVLPVSCWEPASQPASPFDLHVCP